MQYLSPQEILYIHSRLAKELNQEQGIKDVNVLKRGIKYTHDSKMFPDKFKKAAGLFFLIAKKEPFKRGNITTALFATKVLMQINKYDFSISNKEISDFIEKDLKEADLEKISSWIKNNSSPLKKD